jgi:hypothetical protein
LRKLAQIIRNLQGASHVGQVQSIDGAAQELIGALANLRAKIRRQRIAPLKKNNALDFVLGKLQKKGLPRGQRGSSVQKIEVESPLALPRAFQTESRQPLRALATATTRQKPSTSCGRVHLGRGADAETSAAAAAAAAAVSIAVAARALLDRSPSVA